MYDYDVIVLGGGPAGSKCAKDLGAAGKKVLLLEKDKVGGTCLHRGCIPSKTYLYMGEILETIHKASKHGIEVGEAKVLWDEAKKRKDRNLKTLGLAMEQALRCKGVELLKAEGTLIGPHEMKVQDEEGERVITAQHMVIALGSRPLFIPIMPQGEHVMSSTEVLDIQEIPKSMVVIGGGVTGVEVASMFQSLGIQVTIIEKASQLVSTQDVEVSEHLKKVFQRKGMTVHLGASVLSAKDSGEGAEVQFRDAEEKEHTMQVSKALVVIGRKVNYDMAFLETLGIQNDGRGVILNEHLQTTVPSIFVIGDATQRELTAYWAEKEAELVAGLITGKEVYIPYHTQLTTIFSSPEIGSIGQTEQALQKEGVPYVVKRAEYAGNAKAVILGEREGFVKILIHEETRKILGVHAIGVHATDLIHQALVVFEQGLTDHEWLEKHVWSHPTLSELFKEALEADLTAYCPGLQ